MGGEACGLWLCAAAKEGCKALINKEKTSNHNGLLVFSVLVEMGGVEPPSESALTGTSPGAAGFCGTLCVPVPFRTGKPASLSVR